MKNKHVGGSFDEFLKEEGPLAEAEATVVKRVLKYQRQRWRFLLLLIAVLTVLGMYMHAWKYDILEGWRHIIYYERPLKSSQHFFDVISKADSLIVRDGGYNCCGSSIDKDTYIFTVTDSDELKDISDHIQFVPFTNTLTACCMCCGYPGLDWYEGTKRVAITSLQHGQRIRWKDFGTSYFGPFHIYGDLPLTIESSIWLAQWLRGHGVTNSTDLSEERIQELQKLID